MLQKSKEVTKWCSIVGAHFLVAPLCFMWCYGNLSEYIDSFINFACSPDCNDANSQWILGLYMAGTAFGIYLMEPVSKRIGMRWTGLLVTVLYHAALLGFAMVMRYSVFAMLVLATALAGPALGATLIFGIRLVQKWAPDNAAVLTATVTGCPAILAMVLNQVITAYVNPSNLKPDAIVGPRTLFSQPSVLERVPKVITIFAGITFGIQIIGVFLVSNPPELQVPDKVHLNENTNVVEDKRLIDPVEITTSNGYRSKQSQSCNQNTKDQMNNTIKNDKRYNSLERDSDLTTIEKVNGISSHPQPIEPSSVETPQPSLTITQMLKTRTFWALFMGATATSYGMLTKNNYYKQFGLLYIPNDQYLTIVGSIIPLVSTAARVTFGIVLDKQIFSVWDTLVLANSINALLCAFWFFAPQVSEAVYLLLVLGLAAAHSSIYVVYPMAILKIFGPEHFGNHYAALCVNGQIAGVCTAVLSYPILNAFGWFWLFMVCSSSAFVGLVMVCVAVGV